MSLSSSSFVNCRQMTAINYSMSTPRICWSPRRNYTLSPHIKTTHIIQTGSHIHTNSTRRAAYLLRCHCARIAVPYQTQGRKNSPRRSPHKLVASRSLSWAAIMGSDCAHTLSLISVLASQVNWNRTSQSAPTKLIRQSISLSVNGEYSNN